MSKEILDIKVGKGGVVNVRTDRANMTAIGQVKVVFGRTPASFDEFFDDIAKLTRLVSWDKNPCAWFELKSCIPFLRQAALRS